ncbi:MAG: TetR/AcrR family transcriptional regulator [Pseudomonadota bacterium]
MPRKPRRAGPRTPPAAAEPKDKIMHAALVEAERVGWDALRLNRVAAGLGLSLADVYGHFRDADAVAEAWLSVADRAMLATPEAGYAQLPAAERIAHAILRWLDALGAHRKLTGRMLLGKLYPGHPHHLAALVFRLSRTVQWVREAALIDAPPPRRQLEEIALTWLFVATVAVWASDSSPGQTTTRAWLARRLAEADRLYGCILGKWMRAGERESVGPA